MGIVIIDRTQ